MSSAKIPFSAMLPPLRLARRPSCLKQRDAGVPCGVREIAVIMVWTVTVGVN